MKVIILAGGHGTRLAEETEIRPKPMVEIGGRPILWHIMKHYAHFNFDEFVVALGYKGNHIKKYIYELASLQGDLKINLCTGKIENHRHNLNWNIELVETGLHTMTGGRIKRLKPFMNDKACFLTYGDAVSNVDIMELLKFHKSHGKLVTMTAVRPPARFGHLIIGKGGKIEKFSEKPQLSSGWINGGYFVVEPEVYDYIENDDSQWEKGPLEKLAKNNQLMAYCHNSFWQCMDTLREKYILEKLWLGEKPPWKLWNEN